MRSVISTSVTPIILGNDRTAYRTAAHLFFKYGLISNIFAKTRTFASSFVFFAPFHPLPASNNDCFTLMALEKFYVEHGESTYLLIPSDEELEGFTKRNLELLEKKFIVRTPNDIMGEAAIFPLAPKKGH